MGFRLWSGTFEPSRPSAYHEAWTHTVKNIGDTDIHGIIYEPQM